MEGPGEGVALRDQLAGVLGRDRFDLWVSEDTIVRIDAAGVLDLAFTSGFLCDAARRTLGQELAQVAQSLFGEQTRVVMRVDESLAATQPTAPSQPQPHRQASSVEPAKSIQTSSAERVAATIKLETFDTLVVGQANQLAARAGEQLAKGKQVGGPLVFWGPPGVGKTHLLSAIKHAYRRRFTRARVLSLTSEQFVGSYVEALRGSGLPSFRQKYRGADLLVLDDLHFMAGKRASLEELQHTFDRIAAAGGKIVIASCKEPGQIPKLGEELLSRLRAGLVCEMATADYATRLELARCRCHKLGLPIDQAGLECLAAGISSGARELLGAIERLRAKHELLGEPLVAAMVQQTISEVNYQTIRRVAMSDIQQVVCDHFGIEGKQLRSNSRQKSVAEPRMLAMWLARKYTQAGWREIGEYFGGRRHSTVISAHRRIESQVGQQATAQLNADETNLQQTLGQLETKLRLA